MHDYELAVLNLLKKRKRAELEQMPNELKLGRDQVMWAVENLRSNGLVEVEKEQESQSYSLTEEGKSYASEFPEESLARQASEKSVKIDGPINKVAFLWAKRNGWIEIKDGIAKATQKWEKESKSSKYSQRLVMQKIANGTRMATPSDSEMLEVLLKRGLVKKGKTSQNAIVKLTDKGSAAKADEKGTGSLNREMIIKGEWKTGKLRPYDVNTDYERIYPARLHPMHDFINVVRQAWLKMGFMEASGPIIESAFWNFDALFSPQDHPTRDMQDTFFLSNPKYLNVEDLDVLAKVRDMHMNGWTQSFNEELSKQALLRTHTTSVSVRNIKKYANLTAENYPIKIFSIGKVFRNETIDYKHLAELHQSDGIIIGDNLSLANLIDTLRRFWTQLGIEGVRFKPSYFPFTEPSLEMQFYDKELGEEVELGGAGLIREEITKAMGTNKSVLAWGLGLDRILMRHIKLDTLSELYKNDIEWLRSREELQV